jgi:hypothetical protein
VLTCWNFARKSKINVRENQRDNQEWTIQRNWQQDEDKHNKIPVGHQHSQTQTFTLREFNHAYSTWYNVV